MIHRLMNTKENWQCYKPITSLGTLLLVQQLELKYNSNEVPSGQLIVMIFLLSKYMHFSTENFNS